MSWFAVDMQAVCIKHTPWSWDPIEINAGCRGPTAGDVVTIREIYTRADEIEDVGLIFYEIVNPRMLYKAGHKEASFRSRYFRPVRRTDISELRKLAVPRSKAPAREDA